MYIIFQSPQALCMQSQGRYLVEHFYPQIAIATWTALHHQVLLNVGRFQQACEYTSHIQLEGHEDPLNWKIYNAHYYSETTSS